MSNEPAAGVLPPHIAAATALTIAGSDPSGGAGLQADLKTFQQMSVYGMSVVTLVTVQNTQAVGQVHVLSPKLVADQFNAVVDDILPGAIKTGALGKPQIVHVVAECLSRVACPIVVDPVMVSKHGHSLCDDDVVESYKQALLPRALLITPNRFEAERLTGLTVNSPRAAAEAVKLLKAMGARHVLLKLGEFEGQSQHLLSLEGENHLFPSPRLSTQNTHGSGCMLSAAIAAKLALGEEDLEAVVQFAIHKVVEAIRTNTGIGKGIHPADIRGMS